MKMSCLYYQFLKDFENRKDGIETREIIKWIGVHVKPYPYNRPIDEVIGSLHSKKSDIYQGAKAIADKEFKRIISIGCRSPEPGEIVNEEPEEFCTNHKGDIVPIFTSVFPGQKVHEVIPNQYRRIIQHDKSRKRWFIFPLVDAPVRNGKFDELDRAHLFIGNLVKKTAKKTRQFTAVIIEGEGDLHLSVRSMVADIQQLKEGPLKSVQSHIESVKDNDGKQIETLMEGVIKLSNEIKEKDEQIRLLQEQLKTQ